MISENLSTALNSMLIQRNVNLEKGDWTPEGFPVYIERKDFNWVTTPAVVRQKTGGIKLYKQYPSGHTKAIHSTCEDASKLFQTTLKTINADCAAGQAAEIKKIFKPTTAVEYTLRNYLITDWFTFAEMVLWSLDMIQNADPDSILQTVDLLKGLAYHTIHAPELKSSITFDQIYEMDEADIKNGEKLLTYFEVIQ